jgi:PKD repeat protein
VKYIFVIILLFISNSSLAQVTADFNSPIVGCLNENIFLENTSMNAEKYEWDFCVGDLESNSLEIIRESDGNLSVPVGASFVRFKGNWYGFVTNIDNNTITKLNFGESLENSPVISNMGNLGNTLESPQDVKAVEDGNNIYMFVSNRENNKLVRLSLGNDINNTNPNVDVLLAGNNDIQNNGIEVVKNNGNWFVFYTAGNFLRVISLGNSLSNNPLPSEMTTTSSFTGVSNIGDISFFNRNNNWHAIIVAYSSRTISRLDFGSDLLSQPSLTDITPTELGILVPHGVNIKQDGSKIYAFVSTNSGNFLRLDFQDEITNIPTFQNLGNFGVFNRMYKTDIAFDQSKFVGLSSNWLNNRIYIFNFPVPACGFSMPFSNQKETEIRLDAPGTYPISLTAFDSNGNSSSITKDITVTNNQAPDITFSTGDNLCISNPIAFNSNTEATITSYDWDFGDGNTSAAANPSYTYASAGRYAVKLSVTDVNGCNNLVIDSVRVFDEPVPDFLATAQGSICSQKPILFENLTNLPTDATFSWDLGDGTSSTEEEPEHVYAEAGEYTVTQSINMAGCMVERTKTITVNPGPSVAFQVANNCLGEISQFQNNSQGQFLDSYLWDFGDGTQSTQANPSHLYDTAGVYNVQLSAFTTNGCDFTISQEVEIQPLASIAFQSDIACAGQPTQFVEQVSIDQANITDYLWDFGVLGTQSDISTEASPVFAYPAAGVYNVSLQVTTSDGCTSSGSQEILVNTAPEAAFEFEETCLNQIRLFSPIDTNNIVTHFWELQNSEGQLIESSQSVDFSYLFDQSGTYQLSYRQENESLCSKTTTQNFTIYEQPIPDFTVEEACVGQLILLNNVSELNGNNLNGYTWFLDGEEVSNAINPQILIENSGNYELMLEVQTQGGCVQNISKSFEVSSAPTADFEIAQTVGAFPFRLSSTALNPQSDSLVWVLDTDTLSTARELEYVIENEGTYLLGLLVTNEAGCTDEYYEQIKVRKPNLDVSLSNLSVNQDDEFTSFLLNISNRGSLVPERIDLEIDLGAYSVTESLESPIYPEQNQNISLSLKLTDDQIRGLSKICIEASPRIGEQTDSNIQNNRICINLESGFKVMDIYPNPAANQFTIPLITPENNQLSISMEDSNGRQVKVNNYDLASGYHELQIQRENLSPGMYFLRIRYQGQEEVKKIILL